MTRRITASAAALAVGTGLMFVAAPAASASETCPSNSICLYYNSNFAGSFENFSPIDQNTCRNLTSYRFTNYGNGSGYNQSVADNTASVVNNTGHAIYIYTVVTDCGGGSGGWQVDEVNAYSSRNLSAAYNKDMSMAGV